jgi:tetratricopeptide (TPR) repeat protein
VTSGMSTGKLRRLAGLFGLLVFMCGCTTTVQTQYGEQAIAPQMATDESQEKPQIDKLPYAELLKRGKYYLKNDNTRLAQLHYSVALKQNPDSADALSGLGAVLYKENKISEAARTFHQALEKDPDNVTALLYLGKISREETDFTNSLKWLEKAAELSPNNPEILTELAITNDSIGQERLVFAEPLYQKVVKLLPHLSASYNNLGFNYLLQGRYAEAIDTFSKALSIDPNNRRTKNNLATAFLLIDKQDKALALFEDTVGKAAAYNNLGYILMTQGHWDQAEAAFKKALNYNPSFYLRAQQNLERLKTLRSGAGK